MNVIKNGAPIQKLLWFAKKKKKIDSRIEMLFCNMAKQRRKNEDRGINRCGTEGRKGRERSFPAGVFTTVKNGCGERKNVYVVHQKNVGLTIVWIFRTVWWSTKAGCVGRDRNCCRCGCLLTTFSLNLRHIKTKTEGRNIRARCYFGSDFQLRFFFFFFK